MNDKKLYIEKLDTLNVERIIRSFQRIDPPIQFSDSKITETSF